MRDIKKHRSEILQFFTANGIYIGLFIGALSQSDIKIFILNYKIEVLFGAITLECITLAVIWFLHREPASSDLTNPFSGQVIKSWSPRFATVNDFVESEAVYHEWFPRSLSVDDSEYQTLLARGGYERVLEATFASREKRIVGYYTVWPISRTTFDDLVSGKLKEKELTANKVIEFNSSERKLLYIPEICVSKKFGMERQFGAALLKDAILYFGKLLDEDASIVGIGAWAYTEMGLDLARRFCMHQTKRPGGKVTPFYEVSRDVAVNIKRPRGNFKS